MKPQKPIAGLCRPRRRPHHGDLHLLLGKTDAWDENSINLKLGRLRIALEPNPFVNGGTFRQ